MSGQRLSDTEYLILISTLKGKQMVRLYQQRWQIELLFGCLKSRGFRFEDTHQQEDERIKTMIFVLALTLCWAVKTGEWLLEQGYTRATLCRLNISKNEEKSSTVCSVLDLIN